MAPTNSSAKGLLYSVSYGLLSGQAHGRRFDRAMQAAGYIPAAHQDEADIIVAHSAGCWQISPTNQAQIIVYSGMPMALTRPTKTWLKANAIMMRSIPSSADRRWLLYVLAHNLAYGLREPKRNVRIIRHAKRKKDLPRSTSTVFITNQDDVWTHSEDVHEFIQNYDWRFASLPGSHNAIWQHPEHVVAIINHHAGVLAKTNT